MSGAVFPHCDPSRQRMDAENTAVRMCPQTNQITARRQSPSSASKSFWNQNLACWVLSLRNVRWHPWSLLWQDDTAPSPDLSHRETSSSSFPLFLQCYMQSLSLEVETRKKSNLVKKSLHVIEKFLVLSFPRSAKHKFHMLKLCSLPSTGYFPKAQE